MASATSITAASSATVTAKSAAAIMSAAMMAAVKATVLMRVMRGGLGSAAGGIRHQAGDKAAGVGATGFSTGRLTCIFDENREKNDHDADDDNERDDRHT
jgi:hypothetical protein